MPLQLRRDPRVAPKFATYPEEVLPRLQRLRGLIVEVAAADPGILYLEETLKWGEPSYLVRGGSTLRVDWKPRAPDRYAMYFKCTSRLVETFREVFGERLQYEKNRAIVLRLDEDPPEAELRACIATALHYHGRKQLPLLGLTRCNGPILPR